ncbi:MAG: SRPBCC family protein [Paracoccaceae bacterium]
MRLVESADIEASVAEVFGALTDIGHFERLALRHGVILQRLDGARGMRPGAEWQLEFPFRGRLRAMTGRVDQMDDPRQMVLGGRSSGFEYRATLSLTALSRSSTRLWADLDVRPKSLTARILLQTLRLGRNRLRSRFAARLGAFAELLHNRIRSRH